MASAEILENNGFYLYRGAHRGLRSRIEEPKRELPFIVTTFYPRVILEGSQEVKLPATVSINPPVRIGSAPATYQETK